MIANFSSAETPLVGSSRSRTRGFTTSAIATSRSFRTPSGSRPAGRSRYAASPNRSSISSVAVPARAGERSECAQACAAAATMPTATRRFSRALSVLKSCGIWKERDTPSCVTRRGWSAVSSWPSQRMRARGRLEVAGDHVDERRLAGAVRADQPHDRLRLDRDVDVGGGDDRAEAAVDVARDEDRVHGYARARLPLGDERPQPCRQEEDEQQHDDAERHLPDVRCVLVGERPHRFEHARGQERRERRCRCRRGRRRTRTRRRSSSTSSRGRRGRPRARRARRRARRARRRRRSSRTRSGTPTRRGTRRGARCRGSRWRAARSASRGSGARARPATKTAITAAA